MLRGLVQEFAGYQWRAELIDAYIASTAPTASVAGSTQSVWAPTQSSVQVAVGLGVVRRRTSPSTFTREYSLDIPALAVSQTWSDATDAAALISELLVVDYLQVFQEPDGSWRVRFGGFEWYAGGAIRWSTGPGEILGPWSATSGIPLIGCPVALTASASSGIAAVYPPVLSLVEIDQRAIARSAGGTRFKLKGESDWSTLPVRLDRTRSAVPCSSHSQIDLLSGTSTWDLQVRAVDGLVQYVNDYTETLVPCPLPCIGPGFVVRQADVVQEHFAAGGQTVWAVPDIPWGIERALPDGFAELIERGGMPSVVRLTTLSVGDCTESGMPGATSEDILLPSQAGILSTVGQSTHPCEDTLGHTCYAPASLFVRLTAARGRVCEIVREGCSAPIGYPGDCYVTDLCTPTYTACCGIWSYAWSVQHRDENPHMLTRWHHPAPGDPEDPMSWLIRLVNYWGSRLHQYSSWFPPDLDDEPESPIEWRLYGDRANPIDYWGPIGQQWTSHPALPEGERRRTRLDLVSEMVGEGYGAVEAYRTWGRHGSYVGASRFRAVSPSIQSTWTYGAASAPLWTCPDATLSFGGGGITINADGTGAGTVVLGVDLASADEAPYWYGLICSAFEVDWSLTNLASVTVRLAGADGTTITLGTSPGTYARRAGAASAYAGDWGRGYSAFDPLDVGADSLPAGESATVATIAERLAGLQLLPGRSAERLEFVLDITDRAVDVFVEYPVLHAPTGTPWMRPLAHRLQALLWPSGAGVELGGARFWDDVGDVFASPGTEPIVDALDRPSTILDALCLRRMLFEARSWGDGLDAEIEAEWLEDWEFPIGLARKHAARSPVGDDLIRRTRAWWHHYGRASDLIVACATNTYREIPPSIALPVRRREMRDLVPDGVLGGWTYAWSQEPRFHIANAGTSIELAVGGVTWSDALAPVPSGWLVAKHCHPVDNEEGASASLRWNGVEYATLSPWHGYLGTFWEDLGATGVANAHGLFGHYWRADVVGGKVRVSRSPVALPPFDGSELVTSGTDSAPALAWSYPIGEVWLAWLRGTELRVAVSRDRGRTFGGETVMAAQARSPRVFASRSGWRVLAWFWHNSGTSGPGRIRIRVAPPRGEMGDAIVLDFDVEDVGLDGSVGEHSLDPWILTAVPDGELEPAEWMSTDRGATWRRIT